MAKLCVLMQVRQWYEHERYGGRARKLYERVSYTCRAKQWTDHVISVVKFWRMIWPCYI